MSDSKRTKPIQWITFGVVVLTVGATGVVGATEAHQDREDRIDSLGTTTAEFQPARRLEGDRPSFPRTRSKPTLVSYPGMPSSERPGPDWSPEHGLWELQVRAMIDEAGRPVDATIAGNRLNDIGMVRRYERLALRAVDGWRFEPAQVDGQPVASEVLMSFYFDTSLGRIRLSDVGRSPYPATRTLGYPAYQRAASR